MANTQHDPTHSMLLRYTGRNLWRPILEGVGERKGTEDSYKWGRPEVIIWEEEGGEPARPERTFLF